MAALRVTWFDFGPLSFGWCWAVTGRAVPADELIALNAIFTEIISFCLIWNQFQVKLISEDDLGLMAFPNQSKFR